MEAIKEYLKELLVNLKKPVPHKWRVQSFSKAKPKATVMAYIDARQAQEVLDAYCDYGWHREHYTIDGKIYCKVGIVMPDGSIQWRSDCGTESNEDKEKGQSSDSFKRACVNFGIGRFLYDMTIQYVDANAIKGKDTEDKKTMMFPYPIDEQGKRIWDMTKYINDRNPDVPAAPLKIEKELEPGNTEDIEVPLKTSVNDNRPCLTDELMPQVIARIKKGERGVVEKTTKAFKVTIEQLEKLKAA